MSVLAGRYTLQRELGSGGEARTWLASDRMTGSSVAVKVTSAGMSHRDRLRAEWQTGIRLMHAHIARVFEFHDDEGGAFYSRQFIDGPDIGVLSRAPLEHILGPVALIADALHYAHARDVVHRDVKATNILLDANGAPYLIDFGVAAGIGEQAGGGSLIASSPQLLAGEPAQPSDDIFALGGLVYELVTGQSPYSSTATADDLKNLVPPRLSTASDGSRVPEAIATLVERMLDKDASKRPGAKQVVEALQSAGFRGMPARKHYVDRRAVATDEVIEASASISPLRRKTSRATPAEPGASREGFSPRTVGIALAVLVALLIGVVFVLPKMSAERGADEPVAETAGDASADVEADDSDGEAVDFNENINEFESEDERLQARSDAERVLGSLLSQMDTLEQRAVRRWGGVRFAQAAEAYEAGDAAYLEKNYALASRKYAEAIEIIEPLLVEVDEVFRSTLDDAIAAFDAGNTADSLRLFELAVAISPNDAAAIAGYERARNLDTVLSLVQQAERFEKELELDAALVNFEKAAELDPAWQAAVDGTARVRETIRQMEFDQRMTEGLMALEAGDYQAARAAFTMAKTLKPESREPTDGLMQVDQGIQLGGIASLEQAAYDQERSEQWKAAVETYQSILEIDPNLSFAQQGLSRARSMAALHERLEGYIEEPDVLSRPSTMQSATRLVVDITRMQNIGPRLEEQRDELTRLLKRAATPLRVQLVSDNLTDVSIYKVGKLGNFTNREVELRPGTYVAVGSRPGYRDVRLEFRVAPEIDMQPIMVRCEEAI
ncbi:MAG: protein kinase [Woeseiaceae bacterium]|nr:protein kinase [Woeseiaceae bacterium]